MPRPRRWRPVTVPMLAKETMLALVFDGRRARLVRDYPVPAPSRGEALLAVRLAGVCKTDLEILKGYMGFRGVMGHEFVGTVMRGPRAWLGRRVTAEINCACRRCDMCRRGLGTHCRDRGVLGIDKHDGVFAQFVAVPVRNLHAVPHAVSDEQAALVEPLAAAFQILKQVRFSRKDKVVIIGDGRLGQLIARVLPRRRSVLLVGKHEAKLALARRQGVRTSPLSEFKPAAAADVVIDASGSAEGFELAMRTVRPRGVIVLKSTFASRGGMNLAPVVINEISVVGSRCGPFADAIAALKNKHVAVDDLITARYSLTDGLAALRAAGAADSMKVLIDVPAAN